MKSILIKLQLLRLERNDTDLFRRVSAPGASNTSLLLANLLWSLGWVPDMPMECGGECAQPRAALELKRPGSNFICIGTAASKPKLARLQGKHLAGSLQHHCSLTELLQASCFAVQTSMLFQGGSWELRRDLPALVLLWDWVAALCRDTACCVPWLTYWDMGCFYPMAAVKKLFLGQETLAPGCYSLGLMSTSPVCSTGVISSQLQGSQKPQDGLDL